MTKTQKESKHGINSVQIYDTDNLFVTIKYCDLAVTKTFYLNITKHDNHLITYNMISPDLKLLLDEKYKCYEYLITGSKVLIGSCLLGLTVFSFIK